VRLYDRLFTSLVPGGEEDAGDWRASLNPASLETLTAAVEPTLIGVKPGDRFQFERLGYFSVDPDSTPERPVFNRTVTLKDTWARVAAKK